jgi:putative ATPase
LQRLAETADGDARKSLVLLETVYELARAEGTTDDEVLVRFLGKGLRRFDKGGEQFYDQISALHKSVRGSNPDAALYWFARMLDGGADGNYLARVLCVWRLKMWVWLTLVLTSEHGSMASLRAFR